MRWSERTDLPEFMVYSAPGHRFVRFVLIVRYKCPTKMAEAQEQGTKRWEEASGGFDASPASPVLWRGEGGPPEPHWSPTTDLTPTQRAKGGADLSPPPSCSQIAREWPCHRQRHVRMTRRKNQVSATHLLDVLPGTTYPQLVSQKLDLGDTS